VIPRSAALEIHPSTTYSVQLKITARATESNLDDEISAALRAGDGSEQGWSLWGHTKPSVPHRPKFGQRFARNQNRVVAQCQPQKVPRS